MTLRRIGIVFLVLLIGGLIAYWFNQNVERVVVSERVVHLPQQNQLLAAEKYLKALKWDAESIPSIMSYRRFQSENTVVLLDTHRNHLAKRHIERLMRWVKEGGHLIVKIRSYSANNDFLMAQLKMRGNYEKIPASTKELKLANFNDAQILTTINQSNIRLKYAGNQHIRTVSDKFGDVMAQITYGKGKYTIVNSFNMFHNSNISKHDHAALLSRLIYQPGLKKVWLVYKEETIGDSRSKFPPFFKYLIPFLIVLAIIILLWMILNFNRFGPPIGEEPPIRRSLMEHIQASGRLIWRLKGKNVLLDAVRRRLMATIELRYPGWIHLQRDAMITNLANVSSIAEDEVKYAIETLAANNEAEFTRIVTTLEALRKSI